MAKFQDPPIRNQIADQGGMVPPVWIKWFGALIRGDVGSKDYQPVFTSLGASGAPTIQGNYYQNLGFTDFWIKIIPAGGGSTSSTAGVTFLELPVDVLVDTACFAVNGTTNSALGVVQASTNRVFPPTWTSITVPVTITGRVLTA